MPANKNRRMLEKQVAENNGQELCNRIKLLCTFRYLVGYVLDSKLVLVLSFTMDPTE